jgi:hypothetical protein
MICDAEMWRCQSSATASVENTTSERAPKTRDAEKRRKPAGFTERRAHVVDAGIDLPANLLVGYAVEAERMILAVRTDGVSLVVNAAHRGGIGFGHFADQEEHRFDALRAQDIEHLVGIGRDRAVIEGQHDLMIGEWQRLLIIQRTEPLIFARVDGNNPAGADGVGMAWAVLRARSRRGAKCDADHRAQNQSTEDCPYLSHFLSPGLLDSRKPQIHQSRPYPPRP